MTDDRESNVILCILDGWGYSETTEYNAIHNANPSYFNKLLEQYPNCKLDASGTSVGLPENQMGNSEIGHMTIGAGQIIENDFIKLNKLSTDFSKSQKLINFLDSIIINTNIHIFGLFSDGGVHCHVKHIIAMYTFIKNFYSAKKQDIQIYTHAVTDGRDTDTHCSKKYFSLYKDCNIQTVSGRYYAMDRDNRMERTKLAYDAIVNGKSDIIFDDLDELVSRFHSQGITDEFFIPSIKTNYRGVKNGDNFIIMNFRADRVRQFIRELMEVKNINTDNIVNTHGIESQKLKPNVKILGMKKYFDHNKYNIDYILPETKISQTIGEIISNAGLKQLRIAETEKYPHVTYFFNGGKEEPLKGEDRIMIDSPKVSTYDLQPEMSAKILTNRLIDAISSEKYNFILVNYANADMIGHTGNFDAAVKAIKCIDKCLESFVETALNKKYSIIITADHGNADNMFDPIMNIKNTAHTLNPVPFVIISHDKKTKKYMLKNGNLSDISKIVLDMMNLNKTPKIKSDIT